MSSIIPTKMIIDTKLCGPISVYLQGVQSIKNVAIVTVHDLGCNHNEFVDFVSSEHMTQLLQRCFWVHIEVPGQGDNEPTLPTDIQFPSIQKLSESFSEVIDKLKLEHVVLIGNGAGGNICARLAIYRKDIALGLILIHCTGTTAGFMESVTDKIIGWKLNTVGMNPTAESYLLLHRFGLKGDCTEVEIIDSVTKFRDSLRNSINPKNLNKFIMSFMERTKLTETIGLLECPIQFLTGSLASYNHTVHTFYNAYIQSIRAEPKKRARAELIEIDGVGNVMLENPDKVAECVQHFLQGLGIATGALNRRMTGVTFIKPDIRRNTSMNAYDQPKGVKNILFDRSRKYSSAEHPNDDVS